MNEILTQEKSIYIQIKEMIERDILRNILLEEGILYKKRGIGMFVATGAKKQIMEKRKKNFYDDYVKSLMAEAHSLGITRQELIAMIQEAENEKE